MMRLRDGESLVPFDRERKLVMEGLKQIASKIYNDSSEAEKEEIGEIFRGIDSDGDGKVTFKELKESGLFTNELLLVLDRFGRDESNGVLDLDEFLILLLHRFGPVLQLLEKYHPGPRICNGCSSSQDSPDFSCFYLLHEGPDSSYDLCYDCYGRGVHSDNSHEDWCMLNHESLALLEFFRHGLISTDFVQESKATRTIHVPAGKSEPVIIETDDLIQIDPPELQFPIEFLGPNVVLGKRSSCLLRVTNKSSYHVTILVTGICGQRFSIEPSNKQVMLPHSTTLLSVYMSTPTMRVPLEMECTGKFFIHSIIVSSEFTRDDITAKMFGKTPGNWAREYELKSFYIYVPAPTNCPEDDSVTKMSTCDLLQIEPQELRLPFVLRKASNCWLRLTNKSNHHVGVSICLTNPQRYYVSPPTGVLLPNSTMLMSLTMREPPEEYLLDMDCSDKFFIYSVVVPPGYTSENFTKAMFNDMEPGNGVEECILSIVYAYVIPSSKVLEEGSSIKPFINKSKVNRTISVPIDISTGLNVEMVTGNLLQIEPLELQFPFILTSNVVLGKTSSCSLQLTNNSSYHVAIQASGICKQSFYFKPNGTEVILPHSTMSFSVCIEPPTKDPLDMEHGDKIFIDYAVASPGLARKYITSEMFEMESGNWVEECELRAVYVNLPTPKNWPEEGSPTVAPINMSSSDLLQIEPRELRLPFVLGKASSCPIWLTNKSDDHVGVWVNHTNLPDYDVLPNEYVMSPHSTVFISVEMKPPKQAPEDMECWDQFYIYSKIVPHGFTVDNLTAEMFKMEPGNGVEICILRAVYVYVLPSDDGPRESSSIHAPLDQSKVERTITVPADIYAGLTVEMITDNLLQIEPLELQLPCLLAPKVILGKSSTCCLQLTNKSDHHVAYRMTGILEPEFYLEPSDIQVILPHSTLLLSVSVDPPRWNAPPECDYKFLIHSIVVSPGSTKEDFTEEMFGKESRNWVERCNLRAIYVNIPPQLEMSTNDDLLQIEPRELRLPFVLGKASSCPIWLTSKSDDHVGVWVNHTNLPGFSVLPNEYVMSPHSTLLISVEMKSPKQAPEDMECLDQIHIFSKIVPPGCTKDDLTAEMFKLEPSNGVEECVLRVFYIYVLSSDDEPREIESPSIQAHVDESKVNRTIYVPADISAGLNVEMITSNLLQIVPLELQFPFIPPAPNVVLEKKSSCSMRLTNEYDYHVAFQVKSSGTSKFEISPHQGVLLPYSTANVTIKLEQPVPLDMDCTDEFSINSVVVAPGFTENDINEDTFITKSGNWIEKCVLKAVYMPTEKEGIDEENSNDHESSVNQTSETNLTISKTFNELQIL